MKKNGSQWGGKLLTTSKKKTAGLEIRREPWAAKLWGL